MPSSFLQLPLGHVLAPFDNFDFEGGDFGAHCGYFLHQEDHNYDRKDEGKATCPDVIPLESSKNSRKKYRFRQELYKKIYESSFSRSEVPKD